MRRLFAHAISLLLLVVAAPLSAAGVSYGRVIAVTDGHSIIVLVGSRRTPVRIAGIEAPTAGQRHAISARQSLIAVCGGEPARMEVRSALSDGTLVARVLCNGVDAGAEQVRRGMATASGDSAAADASLLTLQADARSAKRGVWSSRQAGPERETR